MDPNSARQSSAPPIHDHDYRKSNNPPLQSHLEYADDVDFCNYADAKRVTNIVEKVFLKLNLYLNQSKTEIITYLKNAYLKKLKKLGTILDEPTESSRRRQLASMAMIKYRKILRNNFISSKTKIMIHNTYVRSILLCSCSTWCINTTSNDKIDAFHRKQLHQCLAIHYPEIVKNEELYSITKQKDLSTHIKERLAHLRHILRKNPHPRHTPSHHPSETRERCHKSSSQPYQDLREQPGHQSSKTGLRGPRQDVCDSRAAWSDLLIEQN